MAGHWRESGGSRPSGGDPGQPGRRFCRSLAAAGGRLAAGRRARQAAAAGQQAGAGGRRVAAGAAGAAAAPGAAAGCGRGAAGRAGACGPAQRGRRVQLLPQRRGAVPVALRPVPPPGARQGACSVFLAPIGMLHAPSFQCVTPSDLPPCDAAAQVAGWDAAFCGADPVCAALCTLFQQASWASPMARLVDMARAGPWQAARGSLQGGREGPPLISRPAVSQCCPQLPPLFLQCCAV